MADLFGYAIAGLFIFVVFAQAYKKKTGKDISELWKGDGSVMAPSGPEYQRVYVNRGIKQ